MDEVKPESVKTFADEMVGYLHNHAAQSIDAIRHDHTLSEDSKADLNQALGAFLDLWEKKVKQNK